MGSTMGHGSARLFYFYRGNIGGDCSFLAAQSTHRRNADPYYESFPRAGIIGITGYGCGSVSDPLYPRFYPWYHCTYSLTHLAGYVTNAIIGLARHLCGSVQAIN